MIDYAIFGFGLAVVILVGSALAILISANNRGLEREGAAGMGLVAAGKAPHMFDSGT